MNLEAQRRARAFRRLIEAAGGTDDCVLRRRQDATAAYNPATGGVTRDAAAEVTVRAALVEKQTRPRHADVATTLVARHVLVQALEDMDPPAIGDEVLVSQAAYAIKEVREHRYQESVSGWTCPVEAP